MTDDIKTQVHPLICSRTGITLGRLEVITVAGRVPYLSQWKETQALHPLFSLDNGALFKFAINAWNNFCSLTPEQATVAVTDKQEKILQVTTLALLHHLTEVQQSVPWLPTIQEVSNCWSSLIQLTAWKNYLESKRFTFPTVRISRFNKAIDLQSYLQACWEVKKEYETKVRATSDEQLAKAADAAVAVLRSDLTSKAPKSKRLLWRWFSLNIPSRYSKDLEGWMWDVFDAETEEEVSAFTIADIDLFEEICLAELPIGTAVAHAFLERLKRKRTILENRFEAFEIMIPDSIETAVSAGTISTEEPRRENFERKVDFVIAHAKWKLAHTDTNKYRRAAEKKQATVTVKATYVPDISHLLPSGDSDADSDDDVPAAATRKPSMWDEDNQSPF